MDEKIKNKKDIRVVFISSWFPTEDSPYNGNFVLKHAEAVSKYANVVFLNVTTNPLKDKRNLFSKANELEGFEEYEIPNLFFLNGFIKILVVLFGILRIRQKYGKVDIVHANVVFPSGMYAYWIKLIFRIPYIISEHWSIYSKETYYRQGTIKKKMFAIAISMSEYICPVSEDLKQNMIDKGLFSHFEIVPNVVDANIFNYSSTDKNKNGLFTFLHISSLDEEFKNIKGIFEAISVLKTVSQDFCLHIISENKLSEEQIALFVKLNISDYIKFFGPFSTNQIANHFKTVDTFLLFSNYETQSCVVLESLVSGIPVISSSVGGVKELINDKNGILVKGDNIEEMAKAMSIIMEISDKFDQQDISYQATTKYSYEAVGKKFVEIYKKSVDNK